MDEHDIGLGHSEETDDLSLLLDTDIVDDADEEVCANANYRGPEKIGGEEIPSYMASSGYNQLDIYRIFSSEINSDSYVIRSYEQQDEWARIKTESIHKLGKLLLKLRYVAEDLLEICRDPLKHRRLFCVVRKTTVKGIRANRTYFDEDLPEKAAEVLEAYLRGDPNMPFAKMSEIIIETYNLSYLKYIAKKTEECLAEFSRTKSIEDDYQSRRPTNKQVISLFDEQNSAGAIRYIEKCNLNWRVIKNIMTTMKAVNVVAYRQRNKLVETNIRMCINIAGEVFAKTGGDKSVNYSKMDLIEEGLIGLIKGVDMYVYGVDAKVTTYSRFWIEQKITRYVKDNNTVRIPVYVSDEINTIIASLRRMEKKAMNSGEDFSLFDKETKIAVEKDINSKSIKNENWDLAVNKYSGIPISLSCVTRDADEESGEISFDLFTTDESDESFNDPAHNTEPTEAEKIIEVARSMVAEGDDYKIHRNLTPLQFELIYLQFVKDKSSREIAEIVGFSDVAMVRTETNKGLKCLRHRLAKT